MSRKTEQLKINTDLLFKICLSLSLIMVALYHLLPHLVNIPLDSYLMAFVERTLHSLFLPCHKTSLYILKQNCIELVASLSNMCGTKMLPAHKWTTRCDAVQGANFPYMLSKVELEKKPYCSTVDLINIH